MIRKLSSFKQCHAPGNIKICSGTDNGIQIYNNNNQQQQQATNKQQQQEQQQQLDK